MTGVLCFKNSSRNPGKKDHLFPKNPIDSENNKKYKIQLINGEIRKNLKLSIKNQIKWHNREYVHRNQPQPGRDVIRPSTSLRWPTSYAGKLNNGK